MKTLILVAALSALALFGIAGLMGHKTGAWTTADDAFFDADTKSYQRYLAGPAKVRPSPLHPLIPFVWRPMGVGLSRVFRAAGAGEGSEMLAARTVVVGFAALALAGVWSVATALGVGTLARVALAVVGMLATSNLIASVPETYGISLGLLSISAAVLWSDIDPGRKTTALAVLTILCAGSTITNGVYPGVAWLASILQTERLAGLRASLFTKKRARQLAIAGLLLAAVGAGVMWVVLPKLGQRFPNFRAHLMNWLHFRIYFEPARTLRDWAIGLVYPIVGPYPLISPGRVTYRTDLAHPMTVWHVAAAAAWSGLLAAGLWVGLRDRATRPFTLGLVAWIAFNLGIHSVWGGADNFLYSPHWSWALLMLGAMAARGLRPWMVVAACAAIVPAQVMTLRWLSAAVLAP